MRRVSRNTLHVALTWQNTFCRPSSSWSMRLVDARDSASRDSLAASLVSSRASPPCSKRRTAKTGESAQAAFSVRTNSLH